MNWLWWHRKKIKTTLPPGHPLNYLGVDADPIIMYLPVHGQVLLLVEAPAPKFIHKSDVYVEGRKLFDIADAAVIPSYYYKRVEELDGYVRA